MKKKILITYAMYGNGHRAVAEYIEKYFEKYPNNPVINFSEVPEGVRKDGFRDPKVFKHNDIFVSFFF